MTPAGTRPRGGCGFRGAARLLTLSLGTLGLGCGAGDVAPAPEELTVTLAVSGGFAGVNWAIRLDGAAGLLIGERCEGRLACYWEPGEALTTVSAERIADLAAEFSIRGFPELVDRDFGTECCDQFNYRLTFRSGVAATTVHGSDTTLPADVRELIDLVLQLIPDAGTASG